MRPGLTSRSWLTIVVATALLLGACAAEDPDPPDTGTDASTSEPVEGPTDSAGEPDDAVDEPQDEPTATELPVDRLRIRHPETLAFAAPFAVMADRGAPHLSNELDVDVWNSPDVLRSLLINEEAELTAVPSYVAANLHNRDVEVRLAAVVVWGMLWLLGPDGTPPEWEELRGATVVVPFPNDMPDLVFRRLLESNGLVPGEDVELRYVSQPPEAVGQLVSGDADWAVLPEHVASLALARSAEAGRELDRVMDLQQAWAYAFDTSPRIPQAGVVVPSSLADRRPDLVERLLDELTDAVETVNAREPETVALLAERFDLPPPLVEDVIPRLNLEVISAADARQELEAFFAELATLSPEIIGGELPGDAFYFTMTP